MARRVFEKSPIIPAGSDDYKLLAQASSLLLNEVIEYRTAAGVMDIMVGTGLDLNRNQVRIMTENTLHIIDVLSQVADMLNTVVGETKVTGGKK
jgi:hypothetical protein